jgi:hypothetical protein
VKPLCYVLAAALFLTSLVSTAAAQANDADAWHTLAVALEPGSTIDLRFLDGAHVKATFIAARADVMVVQRKTRVPVAVETIRYDAIASMARAEHAGLSAGKVTAIALGSAGAAIGAFFLILLASLD